MQTPDRFEALRIVYDQAWEQLRREVTLFNAQQRNVDEAALAELRQRVESAEAAYRRTRDELAEFLIEQQSGAEEEESVLQGYV